MYKFGAHSPRQLESFGVSGLLGEECRVFYENLFSTRHIGRFSDLLAARLRNANADELRLRTLLLFGVFEAYLPQAPKDSEDPLLEPMSVECGIDNEKIAIGVTFTLPESVNIDFEGLAARITSRKPRGRIESLLTTLVTHAHRVLVRTQPGIRRVEVVSVLGISGKMDSKYLAEAHTIDVLVFEQTPEEAPKPTAYIEMGDLDYPALLREENSMGQQMPPSPTGEVLVQATAGIENVATRVSGGSADDDSKTRVSGGTSDEDSQTRIRGTTQNDQFKKLVRGGSEQPSENNVVLVNGSGNGEKTQDGLTLVKGSNSDVSAPDDGPTLRLEEASTAGAAAADYRMISAGAAPKKENKTSSLLKRLGLRKEEQEEAGEQQPSVDSALVEAQAKAYQDQIRALEKKIEFLQKAATPPAQSSAGSKLGPFPGLPAEDVAQDSDESTHLAEAAQTASEKLWNQGDGDSSGGTLEGNQGPVSLQEEGEGPVEDEEVGTSDSSVPAAKRKTKKGLLRKIWPFKKNGPDSEEQGSSFEADSASTPEESREAVAGNAPESAQTSTKIDSALPEEALDVDNLETASDNLVKEIETGHFNSVINNARVEASALQSEIQNAKTKKWMDGLMGELVSEKSRLHDFAKKLSVTIHRKEYQFRVKHTSYQEEIRRKDDAIRQKTVAFDRLKEQLNQTNMTIERLKNAKQTSSGEEVLLKQKLMQTQSLLTAAKDENKQLQIKIDEFKKTNGAVQGSAKNRAVSYDELNAMKTQMERAQKQAEEFKKANQLLMERLNESKKNHGTSNASMEEMKKKLEAAMKMATSSKRDIDRFSQRTESLQKEEMRLKIELGRAMEEIKKLKIEKAQAGLTRPMGRSSKTPAKTPVKTPGKGTPSAA